MVDYPAIAEAEMLLAEPYNAADPKAVNEARKKAARERREELDYLKQILSSAEGRRWLLRLMALGDILADPYNPGNSVEHTHVNMGVQKITRKLWKDILELSPEDFSRMYKESQENIKS